MEPLFADLGAHVVGGGGETLNPSTYELLAGIHTVPAEEVLVLPNSSNVIMAAERACELSEKPARVLPIDLAAGRAGWPWWRSIRLRRQRKTPPGSARLWRRSPPVASRPAARDDAQGRFRRGDAVGFAGGEIVAWGGAGRPWRRRSSTSPARPRSSP